MGWFDGFDLHHSQVNGRPVRYRITEQASWRAHPERPVLVLHDSAATEAPAQSSMCARSLLPKADSRRETAVWKSAFRSAVKFWSGSCPAARARGFSAAAPAASSPQRWT